jgi:hypothetical protein
LNQYANGALADYQITYFMGDEPDQADANAPIGPTTNQDGAALANNDQGAMPAVTLPGVTPALPGVPAAPVIRLRTSPKRPAYDGGGVHKNPGFQLVQQGDLGIDMDADDVHHVRLVKANGRLMMFVDGRGFVNWLDDGSVGGPALGGGHLGLRQSRHAHFRYSNFVAWRLAPNPSSPTNLNY